MNVRTVRRLALALPGVEEGPCYGTPGFRVKGRFLARLWEDGETLVVSGGRRGRVPRAAGRAARPLHVRRARPTSAFERGSRRRRSTGT